MNDSHFENLIKVYRKVSMTPQEKREVFLQSMLVIEKIEAVSIAHSDKKSNQFIGFGDMTSENTSGTSNSLESGHVNQQVGTQALVSNWLSYIKRRQFVPALLSAFILLFTGGASLLADEALPGDSLYSFKVNVNESIREFTAVTNEAKAKLAVEVTERRLQEAAVLSSQGKLDADNKKIIQDEFTKHADQIRNRVASLVANNKLNAAQEVVIDFESTLKTHEIILERLSIEAGDTDSNSLATVAATSTIAIGATASSTTIDPKGDIIAATISAPRKNNPSGVSSLLIAVKNELDTTKLSRIGIDEKVMATYVVSSASTSTSTSLSTPSITGSSLIIESNIKDLRYIIGDIKENIKQNSFSTSTIDLANRRIGSASSSIAIISTHLKAGRLADAAALSRVTLQSLAELQTILKLDKTTKASLDGKVDIASIIESAAYGDTTDRNASSTSGTITPTSPTQPTGSTNTTSTTSSATIGQ